MYENKSELTENSQSQRQPKFALGQVVRLRSEVDCTNYLTILHIQIIGHSNEIFYTCSYRNSITGCYEDVDFPEIVLTT